MVRRRLQHIWQNGMQIPTKTHLSLNFMHPKKYMNVIRPARFRLPRSAIFGMILSQALSLNLFTSPAFAQNPNAALRPALPTPVSPSSLIGLDQLPQIAPRPSKTALPNASAPSSVIPSAAEQQRKLADLIQLYQEAAFSDPALNATRFNYQASKELYWQGLSILLPQANATPTGTRYYQHGAGELPWLQPDQEIPGFSIKRVIRSH